MQKRRDENRSKLKQLQDKRSKSLAAKFILGESSVTYRPPLGYYGNFGANESNVKGSVVVVDDDDDKEEEVMDENTSSEEYVKLRKPKKGFIKNEIVYSDDDNFSHDETLRNNLNIAESTIDSALNAIENLNKSDLMDDKELNKDKCDIHNQKQECDAQNQQENRDVQKSPPLIRSNENDKKYFYDPNWREGIGSWSVDNRGFGIHKEVLENMAAGNEQDQALIGVLNQVVANQDTTLDYGENVDEESMSEGEEEDNYSDEESDYVSQEQGEEEDEESEEYTNENSGTESNGACTSSTSVTSETITGKSDYFSATSPYEDQGKDTPNRKTEEAPPSEQIQCDAGRDGQKGAERDVQGGEAPPSEQMQRDTGHDGQSEEANRDGQEGVESEVQGGEAPPSDVQCDNKTIVVQPEVYRISNCEIYQNEILNDVIDLSGQLLYNSRTGMAYNMDNIDISQFTQLYFVDHPSDFTQFTQIKPHDCVPVVKSEDDDEVTIRIEQSAFVQHPPDGEKSGVDETGDRQSEQQTPPECDLHKEEEAALLPHPPDGEKSGLDETGDRHSEEQTTSEPDKEEEVHSKQSERDGQSKQQTPSECDGHSEQSEHDGQSKQQTPSERNGHKEEEVHSEQSERDGQREQQTPSERDRHKEEEVHSKQSECDTSVVSDASVVILSNNSAKHEVELIVLSSDSDVTDTDGNVMDRRKLKKKVRIKVTSQ